LLSCSEQVRKKASQAVRGVTSALEGGAAMEEWRQREFGAASGPSPMDGLPGVAKSAKLHKQLGDAGLLAPMSPGSHRAGMANPPLMSVALKLYGQPEGSPSSSMDQLLGHGDFSGCCGMPSPTMLQQQRQYGRLPEPHLPGARAAHGLQPLESPYASSTNMENELHQHMVQARLQQQAQLSQASHWPSLSPSPPRLPTQGSTVPQPSAEVAKSNAPRLRRNQKFYKTKKCKFYSSGTCHRGDECTFIHDDGPVQTAEMSEVMGEWRNKGGHLSPDRIMAQPCQLPYPGAFGDTQSRLHCPSPSTTLADRACFDSDLYDGAGYPLMSGMRLAL